jgi:septal ring factor EnvC (AmiA/AmiB activator)
MLFEEAEKPFPSELLEQLKEKAREVSRVLREAREENQSLRQELGALHEELNKVKVRLTAFEAERGELKTIVEELLKEFEQVSR